jgi:hypothetical protein
MRSDDLDGWAMCVLSAFVLFAPILAWMGFLLCLKGW